ncbi:sulfoxide reductase catalytic subunit YedY [Thiogranum longum]|uniref:Protein-methionine-sulfoxide reductase catalytic subunit MsrP n=1 Tax=Thiogranum longum TaxID=1537524 RepID=A0A4R1HA50_9GAMM|nr:protein-methionine-sulfoxide reductase catalytic subunit MsrP [Thiogranum longum]TCK17421.1 sulfoxide reductase catalytic subunit YedY [Thiogranum longum]
MLIRKPADLDESDVTPYEIYQQRRKFMQSGLAVAGAALTGSLWLPSASAAITIGEVKDGPFSTDENKTDRKDVLTYNNFYEFGVSKSDPFKTAHRMKTDPWSVEVVGECEKPGTFSLEDILAPHALEERIYRLRCVEGWSMVIPWIGFPLADLVKRFAPTSKARFVEFETLYDKKQMPGQRRRVLDWPYREGLRMDEAMNPLTLMAVGLYGETLPNQNGAPLRLVVPWKYGFKSIKSIVKIRFRETQPTSSWMKAGPREYGFYSNVNPNVPHPRWSQKRERRIGELRKRKTLMFNGYEEQVAAMYSGMDLKKYF